MALDPSIIRSTRGGGMVTSFPSRAFDITPSDAVEWDDTSVTVWVNGAGDVVVEPWQGGGTVTFTMLAAQLVPVAVRRVLATGTTATGLIGVY